MIVINVVRRCWVPLRIAPEIIIMTHGALMFTLMRLATSWPPNPNARAVPRAILHDAYQNTDIQAIRRDV